MNRNPFYKRLFGSGGVDAGKLGKNANELPEAFLKKIGVMADTSMSEIVAAKNVGISSNVGVSSFDYESLQVMNILGLSPGEAVARDIRKIGAAYKAEVGMLEARQPLRIPPTTIQPQSF